MTTEKTAVALRILTAFNEKRHREERVVLLRAYCPDDRETPIDQLACRIVWELYERLNAKGASASPGNSGPTHN